MAKIAKIHQGKKTFRRHHLADWLAEIDMKPMELLNALNEAADMERPIIDKSQVYRWLAGQLPHRDTQIRIAAVLQLFDKDTGEVAPELLLRHPAEVWMAQRLVGRSPDEIARAKQAVELVLPPRKAG